MRRLNAVSVKVKAPSRGLVTRWPGEIADQLLTGDYKFSALPGMANRVSTFASNVRYEDGVIKNAPGYLSVIGANNIVAHWPLDEAEGTRFDTTTAHNDLTEHPFVDQVVGQFNFAAHFPKSLIFDDMESYMNGAALAGLNGGIGWTDAYTDRSLFIWDDMESYTNGASLDTLNGGINWSGAYADR